MTRDIAAANTSPLPTDALRQLVETELSTRARAGHVVLLLVSLLMTIGIVSLWGTEPSLPARTQLAFGVMTAIGLSWSAFAIGVLTRRRTLFVRHRIMAGRLAVTFSSVFVVAAVAAGFVTGVRAALPAAVMGAVMLAAAVFVLLRARRAVARLERRREVLERRA